MITNDGVTIAEIDFEDRFENMGAELVMKFATKTNDSRRNHHCQHWPH